MNKNIDEKSQEIETALSIMSLFKEFLEKEHTSDEYKDFYFDMIEKCPNLKRFMFVNEDYLFKRTDVTKLYFYYSNSLSETIHNKKSKKKKIKYPNSLKDYENKRRLLSIIKWITIAVMTVTLFIIDYPYILNFENSSIDWAIFTLSIVLFFIVAVAFDFIIDAQYEHYKKRLMQIKELQNKTNYLFQQYKQNYDNHFNKTDNYYLFLKHLYFYETIIDFLNELKTIIEKDEIYKDIQSFEKQYENTIKKIINVTDKILLNKFELFYLNHLQNYTNTLKENYDLTINLFEKISANLSQFNDEINEIEEYKNIQYKLRDDEIIKNDEDDKTQEIETVKNKEESSN